jgi:hypothetical protein
VNNLGRGKAQNFPKGERNWELAFFVDGQLLETLTEDLGALKSGPK